MTTANMDSKRDSVIFRSAAQSFSTTATPESCSAALYKLTRIRFSEQEARFHWDNILRHGKSVAAILGRDIGISVAACDYLVNVAGMERDVAVIPYHVLMDKEDSIIRDDLTGLYNRRYFNSELQSEIERYTRFGASFSLLMVDIDHFKIFNDTHGHAAGDVAIKSTANVMNMNARLYDRVVRYGGEEFTVILPQTNKKEAVIVAERIRQAVQDSQVVFAGRPLGALTVSAGVASFPADSLNMEQLVQFADQALYTAKEERNKVVAYKDSKRDYPRLPLHVPVHVLSVADGSAVLLGKAKDISFGGLLCESRKSIRYDSSIAIVIEDKAHGARIQLDAEVVRVAKVGNGKYHLGVSFLADTDDIKNELSRMIISLASTIH